MKRVSPGIVLAELAKLVSGELLRGNPDASVDRLASLESADASSVAVLSQARYRVQASESKAGVIVTEHSMAGDIKSAALVLVRDPYRAYGALAREFASRQRPQSPPARHPSAVLHPSASVHRLATIGAGAVIEAGASVEEGAVVGAGCFIGEGAVIGSASLLHPRVSVLHDCEVGARCVIHSGTVIGSDGFGFARHEGRWEKIPQLGRVVIGADVEIGANCSIDRGALDDTLIGEGCKLDNLIQVAHNVRIGEHTAIAACVGIAGSARIGRRCMIGGAAGILGHLEICDDVTISAMSLVTRSIDKPGFYSGIFPLMDNADWEKAAVLLRRLPDWRRRLQQLESHFKETQ